MEILFRRIQRNHSQRRPLIRRPDWSGIDGEQRTLRERHGRVPPVCDRLDRQRIDGNIGASSSYTRPADVIAGGSGAVLVAEPSEKLCAAIRVMKHGSVTGVTKVLHEKPVPSTE